MRKILLFVVFISLLASCEVRKNLYVDVVKPSEKIIQLNNRSFTFLPVDGDFDNDTVVDTLLSQVFYQSMAVGFKDNFLEAPFIDSSAFSYRSQLTPHELLIDSVTGNPHWQNMRKIALRCDADYLMTVDDVRLLFNEEVNNRYYDGIKYYQKIRTIRVIASFALYAPFVESKMDAFDYREEFVWDGVAELRVDVDKELPSVQKTIKEAAYWSARDYMSRLLPQWEQERRYIYSAGNAQLREGYQFFEKGDLDKAKELWLLATNDNEPELASRAWSNLAYISEIQGDIATAMKYAMNSYKLKPKTRTKDYLEKLKQRFEANAKIEQYFSE